MIWFDDIYFNSAHIVYCLKKLLIYYLKTRKSCYAHIYLAQGKNNVYALILY